MRARGVYRGGDATAAAGRARTSSVQRSYGAFVRHPVYYTPARAGTGEEKEFAGGRRVPLVPTPSRRSEFVIFFCSGPRFIKGLYIRRRVLSGCVQCVHTYIYIYTRTCIILYNVHHRNIVRRRTFFPGGGGIIIIIISMHCPIYKYILYA